MNRIKLTGILIAVCMLAGAVPASAHHSFSAEFDADKKVRLEGRVVRMDWTNPHTWLYIDVPTPEGKVEHWAVEGGSPGGSVEGRLTRNSLPEGTKNKVNGFQAEGRCVPRELTQYRVSRTAANWTQAAAMAAPKIRRSRLRSIT